MGTILNPTRKSIAREQLKKWPLVKVATIEQVMQRAPWTPFEALNIGRKELRKVARIRRILRRLEEGRI